jgi:Protein of unknown function (DUF1364)
MSKLRDAARGQDCMIRIPGLCNFNSETTVLAHFRLDTGMGQKPLDLVGSWACSACHDLVDGRAKSAFSRDQLDLLHLHGMVRTLNALHKQGKLK